MIDVVLGAWLFGSAFAWPHLPASFANTSIAGALLAVTGALAVRFVAARALCGAVALWLVASTPFLAAGTAFTFWHDLVIGVVALLATIAPDAPRRRAPVRLRAV